MPSADVSCGTMSAPSVLMSPRRWKIRKVGITVSWNGMRAVASSRISITLDPRNWMRANAYPARLHRTSCARTAEPAHPPLGLLDPGTMQRDVDVGHGPQGLLAGHSATLFLRP